MAARMNIPAEGVEAVHARIEKALGRLGVETQPAVAARIVELMSKPESALRDYGEAIRADSALTGRLLRLANSAFFAQRHSVTSVERALLVLGLDRVKSVSLGFYISRGAPEGQRAFSRRVWAQSLFRACLSSALARACCGQLAGEAFVVGLMLDSGMPLMHRLGAVDYDAMAESSAPGALYQRELETMEFTHVDVAAVLARRWKLPPLLALPIVTHHNPPARGSGNQPVHVLQRIAYYTGSLLLTPPAAGRTGPQTGGAGPGAARSAGFSREQVAAALKDAQDEYDALRGIFSEVAETHDPAAMALSVHAELVEIMDRQVARAVELETRPEPERLVVAGQEIELEPGTEGEVTAFILGHRGDRLISCTVNPVTETPASICRMLGLDGASEGELADLAKRIHAMAA